MRKIKTKRKCGKIERKETCTNSKIFQESQIFVNLFVERVENAIKIDKFSFEIFLMILFRRNKLEEY